MEPVLSGITGGSGVGKSTVCFALKDKYPDQIAVLQLDDYYKPETSVLRLNGYANWEHPKAFFFDRFIDDLECLKHGKSVIVQTKNERYNPEFPRTQRRIAAELAPRPIVLVEGFLVLSVPQVRTLLDATFWLDASHDIRWARQIHFRDAAYEARVLRPMHQAHVEPTKQWADWVLDVTELPSSQVVEKVEQRLCEVTGRILNQPQKAIRH